MTFFVIFLFLFFGFMAIIVIGIKRSSAGPVLYRQKRVGKNEKIFNLYKFRTMHSGMEGLGYSTKENDPRIFPFGNFLRKTSLDELPQLINVLKGDMSLVGPRPYVPDQKDLFCETFWKKRCSVKPGMTGLAQVSGRSSLTFDDVKRLDEKYIDEKSFLLDLKILLKTMVIVFNRKESF